MSWFFRAYGLYCFLLFASNMSRAAEVAEDPVADTGAE